MAQCANCGRRVPEDPNQAADIDECRYCDAVLCSDTCLEAHEARSHGAEALPPDDDDRA